VSVFNTFLAGLLLGLLYLDPRGRPSMPSLGLCVGVHAGWNITLGDLLSLPVSGKPPGWHWLAVTSTDARWSGGAYGLEAGLATTLLYAPLCLLLALRLQRSMRGGGAVGAA
jgi:hypothetical protein